MPLRFQEPRRNLRNFANESNISVTVALEVCLGQASQSNNRELRLKTVAGWQLLVSSM